MKHVLNFGNTKSTDIKVMPEESNENDPVAVNTESTREEVLDIDIGVI